MRRTKSCALVLTLLSFACGGGDDPCAGARAAFEAGDLERAEELLAGQDSLKAIVLREDIAEVREARAQAQAEALAESTKPEREAKAARDAELLNAARAEVKSVIAAKDWARGHALLERLEQSDPPQPGLTEHVRGQLRDATAADVQRVLAEATALEHVKDAGRALEFIAVESARLPKTPEFEPVHQRQRELAERVAALPADARDHSLDRFEEYEESPERAMAAAQARFARVRAHTPSPEANRIEELVALARESVEAGKLVEAQEHWLAASRKTWPGDLRDDYVGEAQDLAARVALRKEVLGAWRSAPNAFAELGVTAVGERGWTHGGIALAWSEITLDEYRRVDARFKLTKLARRGVVCEVLQSRDAAERERAFAELARMATDGDIWRFEAANIVTRARGGVGATERFVLVSGQWKSSAALATAEHKAEMTELTRTFERAGAEQREAAFASLYASGDDTLVATALTARTHASRAKLEKNRTLEQLENLAELRQALDDARKAALALIFDEETYFYPYNPPEPPKTPSDYARAQRQVDEAVNAVRDVWKRDKSVHLPKDFRAALDDFVWCSSKHAELDVPAPAADPLPTYVLCLRADQEELDLRSFAWDAEDAAALSYSRHVSARNEALWKALDLQKSHADPAAVPDVAEREQVRITNAYRQLMGRRALAWNAKIQVAAQGHSDYMANTGDFGHFEKDPARKGPSERMTLAGYKHGVSENCAMSGGDPQSAHDGWVHSSGHHRNILMEGHREMASAIASFYWTQNFGTDTSFVSELEK